VPTYEYKCPVCGGVEDIFFISYQKMIDAEIRCNFSREHECTECMGIKMQRQVSAPHVCERPTLMKITGS